MTLALSSRWFPPGSRVEGYAQGLQALGLRALFLVDPPSAARTWREALASAGVQVAGVAPGGAGSEGGEALDAARFPAALARAVEAASALRSPAVVVEVGRLAGETGVELEALERRLREALSSRGTDVAALLEAVRARRAAVRTRLVEQVARALHGPLAEGVPVAVRNGDGAAHLLSYEETGWLLGALPRLSLWFDPARALREERLGLGPALSAWTDAYARRTTGAMAHGLGSDLRGHGHPEDAGPDWGSLGENLPRRLTWVLDLSGRLSADDVKDAVRYLRAAGAFGRGGTSS